MSHEVAWILHGSLCVSFLPSDGAHYGSGFRGAFGLIFEAGLHKAYAGSSSLPTMHPSRTVLILCSCGGGYEHCHDGLCHLLCLEQG